MTGSPNETPSAQIATAAGILRGDLGERARTDFLLAPLTTFRLGGPAALYLEAEDLGDLEVFGRAMQESSLPFLVLGRGSNILISDAGFPGLVLRLGKGFRWSAPSDNGLEAGGATPMGTLANDALKLGLAGLEFGIAIPATLGGAVKMNAGAHGHEMAEVVHEIDLYRLAQGRAVVVKIADAGFGYRRSELPWDGVVTGTRLRLAPGEEAGIKQHMEEARIWRRDTQPIAEPNCGSVFKNPPGAHAALLIEEAGLKEWNAGSAHVSAKHANFIVAAEGATAADVIAVIRHIQDVVEARSGILLEPEVHLVGEFDERPQ